MMRWWLACLVFSSHPQPAVSEPEVVDPVAEAQEGNQFITAMDMQNKKKDSESEHWKSCDS